MHSLFNWKEGISQTLIISIDIRDLDDKRNAIAIMLKLHAKSFKLFL